MEPISVTNNYEYFSSLLQFPFMRLNSNVDVNAFSQTFAPGMLASGASILIFILKIKIYDRF